MIAKREREKSATRQLFCRASFTSQHRSNQDSSIKILFYLQVCSITYLCTNHTYVFEESLTFTFTFTALPPAYQRCIVAVVLRTFHPFIVPTLFHRRFCIDFSSTRQSLFLHRHCCRQIASAFVEILIAGRSVPAAANLQTRNLFILSSHFLQTASLLFIIGGTSQIINYLVV